MQNQKKEKIALGDMYKSKLNKKAKNHFNRKSSLFRSALNRGQKQDM